MILEYVSENPFFYIYYSSDGGKTWKQDGDVNIKSDSLEYITNYSFSDKNTLYIIDIDGNIVKKTKEGNSWK